METNEMNSYIKTMSHSGDDVEEMMELWEIAGKDRKIPVPNLNEQWEKIEQRISVKKVSEHKKSLRLFISMAAVFTVILGVSLVYKLLFAPIIYTSENHKLEIILADGTQVTMNNNSRLEIRPSFNEADRNVILEGEAYFKVTKSTHPFIITTQVAQVKVVGTEFNVKAREDHAELIVNEGIVDFSNVNSTDFPVRVTKGLLAKCRKSENPGTPVPYLYQGKIDWMNGRMQFQESTLAEICRELKLNKGMEIIIENDSLQNKLVSGVLEDSKPNEIMEILCMLTQRKFRVEHNKYVIY